MSYASPISCWPSLPSPKDGTLVPSEWPRFSSTSLHLVLGSSPDVARTMYLGNTSSTNIRGFRDKDGNMGDEVK